MAKPDSDLFGPKPRRKRVEFRFHLAVLAYLNAVLPRDAVVLHVPMGGSDPEWRRKCAALGALPGAPDLLIFWGGRCFGLELKSPSGSVSVEQKAVHERLRGAGCEVFVARTVNGLEGFLRRQGVPLRGRIAA